MNQAANPSSLSGVLTRLETLLPTLPPTARRIAEFIAGNAQNVVHMSVTEVAEGASASEGSVIGLCQMLGARGFQEVKLALARDLVQPIQFIHEDLVRDDGTTSVISKIFRSGLQALQDTERALNPVELDRAVSAIRSAKRVEVFGIGSAAPIAEDANYRFLRIGLNSRASIDSHVQAITASLAGPDIAVLTISHSGSTVETLAATKLAKQAGATTIAITNFGKSPLLAHTDIVLNTLARETQFRTEAMTSRIAQLAVVDTLIACLALADYDRAVATINSTFDVLTSKRV